MPTDPRNPALRHARRATAPEHVVLVLPGGAVSSRRRGVGALDALAIVPFVRQVRRAVRGTNTAVEVLRYRYGGWNAPDAPAVADARWAFERIHTVYGDVAVTVVALSLGARVALHAGLAPNVRALALIAPWLPEAEDVGVLAGRDVLIVHGSADKQSDPLTSYDHAVRARAAGARVARFVLRGAGHAQLPQARYSLALVRTFVAASAGSRPMPTVIDRAMARDGTGGLDVVLPRRRID
jgi:hypothetical protein